MFLDFFILYGFEMPVIVNFYKCHKGHEPHMVGLNIQLVLSQDIHRYSSIVQVNPEVLTLDEHIQNNA